VKLKKGLKKINVPLLTDHSIVERIDNQVYSLKWSELHS